MLTKHLLLRQIRQALMARDECISRVYENGHDGADIEELRGHEEHLEGLLQQILLLENPK